jgi:major type 1 subunit fimbrin (pilin)
MSKTPTGGMTLPLRTIATPAARGRRMRIFGMWLAVATLMSARAACAADATIAFMGTFLQPTCELDSSSASQTIDLGRASVVDFAAVGSTGNPKPFSLNLTNCLAGTQVTMTVNGTMDTVPSVLQNTGTASRIGVQLLQASAAGSTTGTPLTLNGAVNLGTVGSTNAMTIPMVAQFYRLGTLGAGSVTATATVNFTYN